MTTSAFKVSFDVRPFSQLLERVAKQVPYATAKALTWTAEDAQSDLRASIPEFFTKRSAFVQRQIKRTRATKRNLTAVVGVDNIAGGKDTNIGESMRLQAESGKKRPKTGGRVVAIPTVGPGKPRKTIRSKTTPSKQPAALLKKKRIFIGEIGGKPAIWREMAKDRIRVLYFLRREVDIPKRWPFGPIVDKAVRDRWEPNARKALDLALRTAKPARLKRLR